MELIVIAVLAIFLFITSLFSVHLKAKLSQKTLAFDMNRIQLECQEATHRVQIEELKKVPTYDAQKLLAEFASGRAILKIEVIDPGDILLRSPRS